MRSGFGQICPVAVACEVFAERWTPTILREMFAGSEHFNDIHRGLPLISRSGRVRLIGSRDLARAFPSWLMLSHFAAVPRPEAQALPGRDL